MKIVLFDIDGTLLHSGGAGKAAMEFALRQTYAIENILETVSYSGRTDQAISHDLLTVHGVEPTDQNRKRLCRAYLNALPEKLLAYTTLLCPGIPELLACMRDHPDVALGLLTGNAVEGARLKLAHVGLWDYFSFGGYGDVHFERDEVARDALRNAITAIPVAGESHEVYVIGDTPLDVRCARAIGAKAIAVATGWHELAELEACRPDLCYRDLSDTAQFLRDIGM